MTTFIKNPLKHLKAIRDLTLISINDKQYIVIACDSAGGIGDKPNDIVKISAKLTAKYVTRVPLFELISCGANPFMVVDSLSVEMNPTGKNMITAIKEYVQEVGISESIQITGTTEDNVPTNQTGLGVTILGFVNKNQFLVGSSVPGNKVVCVGKPKSGPDDHIQLNDPDILTLSDLIKLRNSEHVKDILPVGSKGILYEAKQMALSAKLKFNLKINNKVNVKKSAGPSTCVLLSINEKYIDEISSIVKAPVHTVGSLESE